MWRYFAKEGRKEREKKVKVGETGRMIGEREGRLALKQNECQGS